MNEEVLLRVGFDASAVNKGSASMIDKQKRLASDYVSFWKRAIADKEAAEVAADTRSAQRSNRARQLWRQRADERKKAWKDELEAQRRASGANPEQRNIRGVNVANLARNVVGGKGGARGHVGGAGAMQEGMTIVREIASGNISGAARSTSILIQRLGLLGRVAAVVASPLAGVATGIAGGYYLNQKASRYARNLRLNSSAAGFSMAGYESILGRAGRDSGGREAAAAAMSNIGDTINSMQSGDPSAIGKFRKWGININSSTSAEDAWLEVMKKMDATSSSARKSAMAQDLLGSSYKGFMRTIEDGAKGFLDAREKMRRVLPTPGEMKAIEESGIKPISMEELKAVALKGWAKFLTSSRIGKSSKFADIAQKVDAEKAAKDKARVDAMSKPVALDLVKLKQDHPETVRNYQGALLAQQEVYAAGEDRLKPGLEDVTEMARQMTGHIRPRLYSVTPRMREAMKISDIESRAQMALLSGDDDKFHKLDSEAKQMRSSATWMTFGDQQPTAKLSLQMEAVNKTVNDFHETLKKLMVDMNLH